MRCFPPYFGGNTRVRIDSEFGVGLVAVDDIRGFQTVFSTAFRCLSAARTRCLVTVGSNAYTLDGAAADTTNLATAPGGISGVLTFQANVTVADGTAGNTVQAANASVVFWPNGRTNTRNVDDGDQLTMASLLDAVAKLRMNAVPEIDGVYNCYLDPVSARQLFADPGLPAAVPGRDIREPGVSHWHGERLPGAAVYSDD